MKPINRAVNAGFDNPAPDGNDVDPEAELVDQSIAEPVEENTVGF